MPEIGKQEHKDKENNRIRFRQAHRSARKQFLLFLYAGLGGFRKNETLPLTARETHR